MQIRFIDTAKYHIAIWLVSCNNLDACCKCAEETHGHRAESNEYNAWSGYSVG